jgi:NADH:ubiquinone oxidoreductase subunit 6 (subunit J)
MKTIFINLLAFGTLISSITAITSKNPVISVIHLIATFVQAAGFLILIGINFVGISYIVVYVGAIAVLFLFVIMMINVRRCAWLAREIINLNPYSNRVLTTELGRRENRRLNIASLIKGIISSNRKERVEF